MENGMAQMYEMKEEEERFILVGVASSVSDDTEESLAELEELASTAGAVTVGKIIQNRESVHPGTYIGKGKIEEVRELALETGATTVVCDDELSPAQFKNLEDALQMKVLDRTVIILDIFANRASTREGKIQVELAQLRYRSTRLIGLRNSLSRLGGGIGTRGPGEKKLEVDRRIIKDRITILKHELEEVKQNRETSRSLRSRNRIPVIAIVGYTNAGKSTLLNYLTDAGVLEEDKLFATLDPTTRNLELKNGQQILITDTVGFIRKLPHHLIESFRSTLEEAKYADIILHVVDSSNPDVDHQMHIVYDTLNKLGIQDKVIITAFNKQDKPEAQQIMKDFKADYTVKISARTGMDVDKLLELIEKVLNEQKILIERIQSNDAEASE
jgi:GTP-binding protein HflX